MKKREPLTQEQIDEYLRDLDEYNSKEYADYDMHIHTIASDGDDSPLMVLIRAYQKGLKTISITDHNSVGGYGILQSELEKVISHLEEIDSRDDISEEKKSKMKSVARMLLKALEEVDIVTGCEVATVYKGCPYVEILAYGVDTDVLDEKLKEANKGLDSSSKKLYEGLKKIAEEKGLVIDTFFMENRSDYRKLFFHELIKHPENAYLYEGIEGDTEEEKAANFAKKYLDNPESDFYVDLENSGTRKAEMQKMIQRHENLVFDQQIIKNAGSASGQFYIELMKHPENKPLIDERITSFKKFIYLGLYNESSPFFVDLSTTKPSPQTVIKAIHEAGGKALIAHWGRYLLSNEDVFNWRTPQGIQNLEEIIDMCDGAECAYPDNPMDLRKLIYDTCKKKGKIISVGGDYHGLKGKEGPQYKLGSQMREKGLRKVEQLEWVKESTINGREFLDQIEEEHQFRKRLKTLLERKAEQQHDSRTTNPEEISR